MDLISASEVFLRERDALLSDKGSHAYLIEGERGSGKFTFALDLACTFFCKSDKKPCFTCAGCRKTLELIHPDVHIFEPDKNVLKVDTVREIISALYESPYEGGKKVYIIKGFDKANEASQNALLKTLEEPPASVCFFLLTENSRRALPTVLSRCKKISLPKFSESEILGELMRKDGNNPRNGFASKNCKGNIGTAVQIASDDGFYRIFTSAEEILKEISLSSPSYPRIASVLEAEKENLDVLLSLLERGISDIFRQNPNLLNLQRMKAVQDAAENRTKRFNEGLICEELSYILAKGGTKWQR